MAKKKSGASTSKSAAKAAKKAKAAQKVERKETKKKSRTKDDDDDDEDLEGILEKVSIATAEHCCRRLISWVFSRCEESGRMLIK